MLKSVLGIAAALALCICAPALAAGPYEPNDSIGTATQLVGGQTYSAAIETSNDTDLFSFYIVGSEQQVDVTVTNTATQAISDCNGSFIYPSLRDESGNGIDGSTGLLVGTAEHFLQTLNEGRYLVSVSGGPCPGPTATYTLRIDPADALTSAGCYDARRLRDLASRAVRRAEKKLKRARRPAARRRLARELALKRRTLRRAQTVVKTACTG